MKNVLKQRGGYLILTLVTIVLIAGCAAAPAAETVQETATVTVPTADPLYALHCIQSGNTDLCYVSEELAADAGRLEKAVRSYCLNKMNTAVCSIQVWKDEASVAQSVPLGEAEAASRIASFSNIGYGGNECYKTYSNGQVVSSSSGCP